MGAAPRKARYSAGTPVGPRRLVSGVALAGLLGSLGACRGPDSAEVPLARPSVSAATSAASIPPAAATMPGASRVAPGAGPPPLDHTALAAAEALCADCHPEAVAAWRASPMGRSLAPVTSKAENSFDLQWLNSISSSEIRHPSGAPAFALARTPEGALRLTERAPGHALTRTATFVIGSGAHTRSLLWADETSGSLWLAPLTWYRRLGACCTFAAPRAAHPPTTISALPILDDASASPAEGALDSPPEGRTSLDGSMRDQLLGAWDLSPGYHHADQPGLFRPINLECLSCHADPPTPAAQGRSPAPPTAIGCARCHGDARDHAAARARGEAAPALNPVKLDAETGRAVCEQCHLQGAVRLVLEGRTAADFVPGAPLASVFAVFERETAAAGFGIASHAARLRRSRCATADGGPLTCTTCHQPHAARPASRAAACASCHSAGAAQMLKQCTKSADTKPEADCVSCHLQKGGTDDIPHVAFTDHWIRRRPEQTETVPPAAPSALVLLGDPRGPHTHRDLLLGQAYAQAARDQGRPADLRRAAEHLASGLKADPASAAGWRAQALVSRTQGRWAEALAAIERAAVLVPDDAAVALERGEIALRAGRPEVAAAVAEAHTAAELRFEFKVLAAQSLAALGRFEPAAAAARAATALRPGSPGGWMATATVARAAGDLDGALAALATLNARAPSHRAAWLQRARFLRELDRLPEASVVLDAAAQHLEVGLAMASRVAATADRTGPRQRRLILAAQARVAWLQGDTGKARSHLQDLLAPVAPGQPPPEPPVDGLVTLAALALAAGDAAQAVPALEAATRADPTDGAAFFRLAEALTALGQTDAAAAARARAEALRIPSAAPLVPGASGRP